jgi:hypothetical protein
MDLEQYLQWLHLEPTTLATLGAYCTGYTWSLLHWLHLEPTTLAALGAYYTGCTPLQRAVESLLQRAVDSPAPHQNLSVCSCPDSPPQDSGIFPSYRSWCSTCISMV